MSGGHEWIFGGGSATGVTVSSGGTLVVSGAAGSAAVASGTTVLAGGIETVFVSATETGGTVSSGGEISVNGAMTGETILAGGNYFIGPLSGGLGLATSTTVFGTGHVESGSTETADKIQSGGIDIISSGGTASATTVNSGGVLVISSGGSAIDTNLQYGGTIDATYVPYVSGATATLNSSTDVLTVTDGANTLTYQMAGAYATGDTFLVSSDTNGDSQITLTPCFCTGTRILTDHGEVAVEQLAIGDRVATTAGTFRPIKWIGHRRIDFARHPEPELAQPILIRTNAIADGAPHRDLHVSPDHAVLLDDVLVPARMLVNGGSIRRQNGCPAVTYYHVELDAHDILLAEGLAAESYLDTGNRTMFANAGMPILLHPDLTNDQDRRIAQSCRPFADDPAFVEPIWRRVAARSAQLAMPLPAGVETTSDPDLCVVINGKTIKPVSVRGERYAFVLPPTRSGIHLVSRATKPNALRPWVEDHRRLGVMIARLTLKRGAEMEEIPLDHPQLTDGWWATERDQTTLWRWTNGDAVVPVARGSAALLEVTLGETLAYPVDRPVVAASMASTKAA
jgi:autotransporter passenger strand-loop-strand repeat protein